MPLVLRTSDADGKSRGGFRWNLEIGGVTTAPDWLNKSDCGNGLHGFLNGEGNGNLANWGCDALWLVVEPIGEIVDLGGRVKFESAITRFVGNRFDATSYLTQSIGRGFAVIGGTSASGDRGTSTSGYWGTSTSGDWGTSTSGDRGTSTSGDWGTSTSGDRGTSTSGNWGTSVSGDRGTSTSGDGGTSISGDRGSSASGDRGSSISGYWGTSVSGDRGASTSGNRGTSTSGDRGTISIRYWDGSRHRYQIGYIGENGLKPNTPYVLDKDFNFVEKSKN